MAIDYVPIACIEHERLEFAVLRRRMLQLTWLADDGQTQYSEPVRPLDVATRDGAEWLTFQRSGGEPEVVRLDRICQAREL